MLEVQKCPLGTREFEDIICVEPKKGNIIGRIPSGPFFYTPLHISHTPGVVKILILLAHLMSLYGRFAALDSVHLPELYCDLIMSRNSIFRSSARANCALRDIRLT